MIALPRTRKSYIFFLFLITQIPQNRQIFFVWGEGVVVVKWDFVRVGELA